MGGARGKQAADRSGAQRRGGSAQRPRSDYRRLSLDNGRLSREGDTLFWGGGERSRESFCERLRLRVTARIAYRYGDKGKGMKPFPCSFSALPRIPVGRIVVREILVSGLPCPSLYLRIGFPGEVLPRFGQWVSVYRGMASRAQRYEVHGVIRAPGGARIQVMDCQAARVVAERAAVVVAAVDGAADFICEASG